MSQFTKPGGGVLHLALGSELQRRPPCGWTLYQMMHEHEQACTLTKALVLVISSNVETLEGARDLGLIPDCWSVC